MHAMEKQKSMRGRQKNSADLFPLFPLNFDPRGVVLLRADMAVGCGVEPPVNRGRHCQPTLLLGFAPDFML
jgi:hypothetical protein